MNNSDTKGKHDLNRKIKKYTIILLIIGCSLTGISLWLILNPNPLVIPPNDIPVMILDIESSRNVDSDRLEVYESGTVLYIMERTVAVTGSEPRIVRIWRKGTLTGSEFETLLNHLHSPAFQQLDDEFSFADDSAASLVRSESSLPEITVRLTVDHDDICRIIYGQGSLTSEAGSLNSCLPEPLNRIYGLLIEIGSTETKEIHREEVKL